MLKTFCAKKVFINSEILYLTQMSNIIISNRTKVNGTVVTKPLVRNDFKDTFHVSVLNAAQVRECIPGNKTEDCWRVPIFDSEGYVKNALFLIIVD